MHVPWTWVALARRRALARGVPLAVMLAASASAVFVMLPAAPVEAPTAVAPRDEAAQRALAGIWWAEDADRTRTQRFYYFHGDGTGLFRYGAPGLTNTNSFDYDVRGDDLLLTFRKTGDRHVVRFAVEQPAPGTSRMRLADDPRGRGATTWIRTSERTVGPTVGPSAAEATDGPGGRMWIDLRKYATGGQGFAMYQLRAPGIDGRGTGWFHRGDFDDWSTEALTYRIVGERIELSFEVRGEQAATTLSIEGEGDARTMRLDVDPRDYGLHHRYRDAGPSFGAHGLGPAALQKWLVRR